MLITHDRERLINAIIYFAKNTKHCGITKLMKLLFLLDFEHYKMTGRSVTGQEYFAYPKGPVPGEIHDELSNDELGEDLAKAVAIVPEQMFRHKRWTIKALGKFNSSLFSNRELRLLESISKEYQELRSQQMVKVTHAENGVWDQVYAKGAGNRLRIPYELSSPEASHPDLIIEKAKEFSALKTHYGKATSAIH
jgi:uncharacterized phage-associated protein